MYIKSARIMYDKYIYIYRHFTLLFLTALTLLSESETWYFLCEFDICSKVICVWSNIHRRIIRIIQYMMKWKVETILIVLLDVIIILLEFYELRISSFFK